MFLFYGLDDYIFSVLLFVNLWYRYYINFSGLLLLFYGLFIVLLYVLFYCCYSVVYVMILFVFGECTLLLLFSQQE